MTKKFYSLQHTVSAIAMVLTLAWLTVSTPFVYSAQQIAIEQSTKHNSTNDNDDNPFANTTEEKAPSSVTLNEEFLHHHEEHVSLTADVLKHYKDHTVALYIAFHGELISPPPEI